MFFRFADNRNTASAASEFRRNRIRRFAELLGNVRGQIQVLDVGGTAEFWQRHQDQLPVRFSLTLLNRLKGRHNFRG